MLCPRQEQRERMNCESLTAGPAQSMPFQASPTRKSSGQHRPRAPARTHSAVLSAALKPIFLFFFSSSSFLLPIESFLPPRQKFDSSGILLHACGVVLAGENNLFFPIPRAAAKKPSCSCSFVCGIQIPCLYSFLHLLFLLHDSFLPIQE